MRKTVLIKWLFPSLKVIRKEIDLRMLQMLLNAISVNNSRLHIKREDEVQRISKIIDCPVEIVQHCMLQIGPSLPAIEAYWEMNKDRLLQEVTHTKSR